MKILKKYLSIYACYLSLIITSAPGLNSPMDEMIQENFSTQEASKQFVKEMELRFQMISLILESSRNIGDRYKRIDIQNLDKFDLHDIYRIQTNVLTGFIEESKEIPVKMKDDLIQALRSQVEKVNLKLLADFVQKSYLSTLIFFKKNGIGMSVAFIIGNLIEYGMGAILYHLGVGALITISALIPYGTILSQLPKFMNEKIIMKNKIIREVGKNNFQYFMEQEKLVMDNLKFDSKFAKLTPIQIDGDRALVASLPGQVLKMNLLGRLGFFNNALTLRNLRKFLFVQGYSNKRVKTILGLKDYSSPQKTAMIISHIFDESDDEELKGAFLAKYEDSIQKIKLKKPWDGFEPWLKRSLKATTINEMEKVLQAIPSEVSSEYIINAWEKIIIPELARTNKITHFSYRRLVDDFTVLKAKIVTSGAVYWNFHSHQLFVDYLNSSFKKAQIKPCKNSQADILKFLIKRVSQIN